MRNAFLFFFLSTAAFALAPDIKPEHLKCKLDKDCTLIVRGGCCPADTPVNAKFAKQYEIPAAEECRYSDHACPQFSATLCTEGKCTVKKKWATK